MEKVDSVGQSMEYLDLDIHLNHHDTTADGRWLRNASQCCIGATMERYQLHEYNNFFWFATSTSSRKAGPVDNSVQVIQG